MDKTSQEAGMETLHGTKSEPSQQSEPKTLDWTKPGPGTWQLDGSHFEPDCAVLSRRAVEIGMETGMEQGFTLMGAPLKGLEPAFVNGNFYYRMVPLVAGGRDLPAPPAPLIWLMTRLHPEFRRREKLARQAIDRRVWNEELHRWQTEYRPQLEAAAIELSRQNPAAMTNDELAEHLDTAIKLMQRGTILHFRLHVSDLGPIGLLLVKARRWGLDQGQVMAALTGSSPATNAPVVALRRIGDAARRAKPDVERFTELDEVAASCQEAAVLLEDFLDTFGWRLTTGYDLQDLTLRELPELLLNAINTQVPAEYGDEPDGMNSAGERALASLLGQVDEADRDELLRLVSDARALYGLRDENGPVTYQWPAGLVRRGLLEAANRLLETGRIGEHRQIFDLESDELLDMLRSRPGPTLDVLAARLAERTEWKQHQAPALLGPEQKDPPLWALPGALAEMMDVVITVLQLIERTETEPTLSGLGIGDKTIVGVARVVTDEIDALARMEPGDVLVAPFTVPTYNAVLATAGAVVVENGGLLCHAAVIAREFGIPGLVGVAGVTDQIVDGSTVRVDPVAGTIRPMMS